MFGLLNVDKPSGVTSRDVVNGVQRLARPHKCGHAGTLDPLANGVLVVAIGKATRLIEYVQRMPKTYEATFLLGRTSDTEDVEGNVVALPTAPIPSEPQLRDVLPGFLGKIEQRPPAYSAVKVAGRRAYDLARRGQEVELASRKIEVHSLTLVRYEYPRLELLVECGSGTYVRSLGRDIARAAETDAVMSALRRTAIGTFRVEDAVSYELLVDRQAGGELIAERLLSPLAALGDMPRVALNATESLQLAQGRAIADRWNVTAAEVAAVDERGSLLAILAPREGGLLQPEKYFGT